MERPQIYLVDSSNVWTPTASPVFADVNPEDPQGLPQVPFEGRLAPPPELGPREAARSLGFEPTAEWEVVPDWRGFAYWTADRQHVVIDAVGVVPPADALAEDPGPSLADQWAALQAQARNALARTSVTVERIVEAVSLGDTVLGAPDVVEFFQYRRALRDLLGLAMPADSADWPTLPNHPGYPAGS